MTPPHTAQDRDFYQQFTAGIRYVDLRACWDSVTNEWHTDHGPALGNPMYMLFDDTLRFMLDYPQEVIIMEVSHFLDANSTTLAELVVMIESYFSPFMYPRANGFADSLNTMIATNQRMVITFDDTASIENHPLLWPGSTIINSYADSPILSDMESYNDQQVDWFSQNIGQLPDQLFKISWTLTPNAETVVEMVLPNKPKTLIELADTANPALLSWFHTIVNKYPGYPILGNILIIDHFETSNVTSVVQNSTLRR